MKTKGIIPTGTTLTQIKEALSKKDNIAGIQITPTDVDSHSKIRFRHNDDFRCMSVYTLDTALVFYKIQGVLINLGTDELAKEVIEYLVRYFGGYYCLEDDSNGGKWQPLNIEQYQIKGLIVKYKKELDQVMFNLDLTASLRETRALSVEKGVLDRVISDLEVIIK